MKQIWNRISLRNKILILLFSIIFISSGLSLIIVQSISNVSNVIKEVEFKESELVWIHRFQQQALTKRTTLEQLLNNSSYNIPEDLFDKGKNREITSVYGAIPSSLESFEIQMDLIDFMFANKVIGLLYYENIEMAEGVIRQEMLPMLVDLEELLDQAYTDAYFSVSEISDRISVIMYKALGYVFIVFSLALLISIFFAYKTSKSITEPIDRLVDDVERISQGAYGLQVTELNQFELNKLTASVNQMSQSLVESFGTVVKEKMLREQILSSIPIAIITVHHETGKIEVNQKAKSFMQIDSSELERILSGNTVPPLNESFWRMFHSEEFFLTRKAIFNKEDTTHHVLVSQSPLKDERELHIGRIFYFIDISEMDYMEKRIHRSEKLAVLGELAAGAAHEIRNPLAVISGFIQILYNKMEEKERVKYHEELLLRELERTNKIIDRMLLLVKPEAPIMKPNSLDEVLNDILPLIHASCPLNITIRVELHSNKVHTDFEQLKQVFYNLIKNSIEAINGEGDIYIYSQVQEDEMWIMIEDSGTGIPLELQEQIFNPFISNKDTGTGLGLSIIQRIIEDHGGEIQLISSNEKGTKFKISLPLLK